MRLRNAAEVAIDLGCSEWTVLELVRQKKVSCVRLTTGDEGRGLVRFTDEQVAQMVAGMTVDAAAPSAPARRKRRAS